jgi:hypothetical protein
MSYKLQPADVQEKWREYRLYCDANIATVKYRDKLVQVPKPIIYTLEGFCLFLDLSEEELTRFENNKNYKACFKKIRYQVMCRKMAALVNGEGNARALIFDLKVNHGIDPKQAREETDWKITLNLNHDNMDPLPAGVQAAGGEEDDTLQVSGEEDDGTLLTNAPPAGEQDGNEPLVNGLRAGGQEENNGPAAGTPLPSLPPILPKPPMSKYSIW